MKILSAKTNAKRLQTLFVSEEDARPSSAKKKTRPKLSSATYPLVVQLEPDFVLAIHVVQAAGVVLWKGGKGRGTIKRMKRVRLAGREYFSGVLDFVESHLTGFSISRM